MAAIGSLPLQFAGMLDSGVAQLLVKPPKSSHEFRYGGASFRLAPDTPFVVCCFSGATSHANAITSGSELLQEGLDMLSMSGGADLLTRDAADEYFAWWRANNQATIAVVSTGTSAFSVGTLVLEIRDASGALVPPTPVFPQHHLGFRYYRMSQASENLFDAFRNMYLAFELLLSAKYPKGKGREIEWLRSSLTAAALDLNLSSIFSVPTPVDHFVDSVYTNTRLPLFHAKDGHAYFAPLKHNQDRKAVTDALQLLTLVVMQMADVWHQTRRKRGAINLQLMADTNKQVFDKSRFIASRDMVTADDELLTRISFEARLIDQFDGQSRPHLHGSSAVSALDDRKLLNWLYIVNSEAKLMSHQLEATLALDGFDTLEAFCFVRSINATEPRTLFPM